MDQWYLDSLVCPLDQGPLKLNDGSLCCRCGRTYPVVDSVPVMLIDDVDQTIALANASLDRAKGNSKNVDARAESLYLESLGISEDEKSGVVQLYNDGHSDIDPVVSFIIGATNGWSFKEQIGKLKEYPIPELRMHNGDGDKKLTPKSPSMK